MGIGKSGIFLIAICLSVVSLATLGTDQKTTRAPGEGWKTGVRASHQERGYCHLLGWTEAESGAYYVFASAIFAPKINADETDASEINLYFYTVALKPGASEELKNQLRSNGPIMESKLEGWVQSLTEAVFLPGVEMDALSGSTIQAAIPDPAHSVSIEIRATATVDQDRFIDFQEVELNVGPMAR